MDKCLNPFYTMILSALIFMLKWSITEGNTVEECACPADIYEPICASNNATYAYSCYLKCAQKKDPSIKGLCYGECPCCKKRYDGDDNDHPGTGWGWGPWRSVPNYWRVPLKRRIVPSYTTVTNNMGRNKNSGASAGVVVAEQIDGCLCSKIYKPVCGSNNVTYGNECVLECQQEKESCLTQACAGECPCCACNKVCNDKPSETGDSKSKYFRLEN